jgi:type II restriction enzyme
MTQSQKLSENKNQHIQKNIYSQSQDVKIKDVVREVKDKLIQKYSNLEFGIIDTLSLHKIESLISNNVTTGESSTIKPDGGFLWVEIKGIKYFILVSEQKRQGTNDKLLAEGKTKQSMGNAAERLGKNVKAFDILFDAHDIYPFVVFLQGCDFFDEESTIGDRIRTIALFQEINKINIQWKKIGNRLYTGGSYYMRGHSMNDAPGTSDWTFDEMLTILLNVATQSTEYYLSKYGK